MQVGEYPKKTIPSVWAVPCHFEKIVTGNAIHLRSDYRGIYLPYWAVFPPQ